MRWSVAVAERVSALADSSTILGRPVEPEVAIRTAASVGRPPSRVVVPSAVATASGARASMIASSAGWGRAGLSLMRRAFMRLTPGRS